MNTDEEKRFAIRTKRQPRLWCCEEIKELQPKHRRWQIVVGTAALFRSLEKWLRGE